MTREIVYINDEYKDGSPDEIPIRQLLQGNYIYAAVNTDNHIPLFLEEQMDYAARSYEKLYGAQLVFDLSAIADRIHDLLGRNRRPLTSNIVYIYIIPRTGGKDMADHDMIVVCGPSTIYHGYAALSLRPKAVIVNYEIPFAGHRTAVSLNAAGYMEDFALRSGAHIALRANRSGMLVSSGDYPLFARRGDTVFTPAPDRGAGGCVERDLMFRACELGGLEIAEKYIEISELTTLDEIMVFGPSGLSSVLSCSGNYYYNLTADRLEDIIASLR